MPVVIQPVSAGAAGPYKIDSNKGTWNKVTNVAREGNIGFPYYYVLEIVFWYNVPLEAYGYPLYNHLIHIDYDGWSGESVSIYYKWGSSSTGTWTLAARFDVVFGEIDVMLRGMTSTTLQVKLVDTYRAVPDLVESFSVFGSEPQLRWAGDFVII